MNFSLGDGGSFTMLDNFVVFRSFTLSCYPSAAVIPIMSKFEPFVKVAFEKMANPDAHFNFLDISANRFCGNEVGVTSLGDGGAHWAHA